MFRNNQQIESNNSIQSLIPSAFIARPTTFVYKKKELQFLTFCEYMWFIMLWDMLCTEVLADSHSLYSDLIFFRCCLAVNIREFFSLFPSLSLRTFTVRQKQRRRHTFLCFSLEYPPWLHIIIILLQIKQDTFFVASCFHISPMLYSSYMHSY